MSQEIIYKDRNNTIDLQLLTNNIIPNLSVITGISLIDTVGDLGTVSSIEFPEAFDWSEGNGVLKLSLGGVETITVGTTTITGGEVSVDVDGIPILDGEGNEIIIGGTEITTEDVTNMPINSIHKFSVILYDTENTDGVYWGTFRAIVK